MHELYIKVQPVSPPSRSYCHLRPCSLGRCHFESRELIPSPNTTVKHPYRLSERSLQFIWPLHQSSNLHCKRYSLVSIFDRSTKLNSVPHQESPGPDEFRAAFIKAAGKYTSKKTDACIFQSVGRGRSSIGLDRINCNPRLQEKLTDCLWLS